MVSTLSCHSWKNCETLEWRIACFVENLRIFVKRGDWDHTKEWTLWGTFNKTSLSAVEFLTNNFLLFVRKLFAETNISESCIRENNTTEIAQYKPISWRVRYKLHDITFEDMLQFDGKLWFDFFSWKAQGILAFTDLLMFRTIFEEWNEKKSLVENSQITFNSFWITHVL